MILPEISIKRPVLASMMSLALVLFGVIGLQRLPVRELPDIDPPIVSVTTVYPGANASVVETEVTERLEEEINNIEGVKTLSSFSREQVSSIIIEFTLARDIDKAAQDVRDRVARVRGKLPDSIKEPIVAKQDSDAQPIIWIGVNSARHTPLELTRIAEKQMKNRLQTVRGVSGVVIGGEQRYAMRLWLDSEKLAAHQLTVLDVERALKQQNVELPSGRVENLSREMTIQTRGEMKTPEEFNQLVIRNDGAKLVRLRDIGEARAGVENERTIARNNGRPCIFLGIVKQSKANTVDVADGIKAEVERLKPSLPDGIEMVFNYDESIYVSQAIDEVWTTLGVAFGLVVIIIWLFLGSFRTTLIPAVAIPVSIIGTFAILNWFGYSINLLTMLALVLAIGVVVDDAIVVLENIHRHIEAGMKPMDAAFLGMKEISFAVIAITISLIAVFLPLAFQKSATGRLFIEFAVAVGGSVAVSAFVALSLSPMMASRLLLEHDKEGKKFFIIRWFDAVLRWFTRGYGALLGGCVSAAATVARPFTRWPLALRFAVGVGFAALVLAASVGPNVWLVKNLEDEFLPEEDKSRLLCFVFTPEGSTTEYTDRQVRKIEALLQEVPEVQAFGSVTAFALAGPGQANQSILFVRLKDRAERTRNVREIVNGPGGLRFKLFQEVEGAIAVPNIPKAIGRGFGAAFQLVIQGQNLDELNTYTQSLLDKLRTSGFLVNARSSFEITKPELRLDIDRNRAAALGVSIEDVSRTMQILFGSLDLSRIKLDGKEYQVIAQLQRESRLTPQDLDKLYIRSRSGQLIQLGAIVTRHEGAAPNAIEHYNRLRSTTISASLVGVPLGTAITRAEAIVKEDLPPNFLYAWSGESQEYKDAGTETLFIIGLALIIVYMTLAAQFESLVHPLTVMLAVPLAGFGAFGALWLVNYASIAAGHPLPAMNLNLFSRIGLVLLVGLVTKNSILLVEFANQERAKGATARDAMLQAGLVRLRPILMTAFSTIAGILPIAIGFGAGAESRRPMGVAIVGGMLTSTFLTLLVIPVVYVVFSELATRLQAKPATVTPAQPQPMVEVAK